MMEWNKVKLDEVLGYTQPKDFIVSDTNYCDSYKTPVLTPGKTFILGYTNEEKGIYKNLPTIIFDDFTTSFKYVDFEFKVKSSAMKMLNLKNDKSDLRFIYYLMLTLNYDSNEHKRQWISKYSKQTIPLPPLAEQQRIAGILDAADRLRKQDQQVLQHYEQLSQSLFLDMFGDPVTNPKGWEKIKLGELGKWQSGGTPSRRTSSYFEGNIPWLSSGELEKMYISESKEHISNEAINESAAKLIEIGSLLLGMYDTAALKSTISTAPLACNQAIAFCRLDDSKVHTIFIYKIIQLGKEHYRRLQRGVRQKNLNLSMIKNIEVLYPPIPLQNQFAERIQAIEAQKALAETAALKSEELFQSLLQRAFKGALTKNTSLAIDIP